MIPRLYSFFNSSTSYRVRIALALKGIAYETVPVNIRTGEQRAADFVGVVNPSTGVPVLEIDGIRIAQSLAIIDFLDRRYPQPQLIPDTPFVRAKVLSFSNLIACDIHPVNNLRVLRFLQEEAGIDSVGKDRWYQHWIAEGLAAAERMLAEEPRTAYCFGDYPTLADCCLVPQIANALRMRCDLDTYPLVMAVYRHASAHPALQAAAPEMQPDYVG